jgi:hypothetical protein
MYVRPSDLCVFVRPERPEQRFGHPPRAPPLRDPTLALLFPPLARGARAVLIQGSHGGTEDRDLVLHSTQFLTLYTRCSSHDSVRCTQGVTFESRRASSKVCPTSLARPASEKAKLE